MNQTKTRQSNFELLRIIAMLMIVMHHFMRHLFPDRLETIGIPYNFHHSVNSIFAQDIYTFGMIGVCIFVLITGYFSINVQVTVKKMIALFGQMSFYGIIYFILSLLFIKDYHQTLASVPATLNLIFGSYWFVNTFLALLAVIPFLNLLIKKISKQHQEQLMIAGFVLWSILPTFSSAGDYYFSNLALFMLLYLIGAYIRVYGEPKIKLLGHKVSYFFIGLLSLLVGWGSVLLFDYLSRFSNGFGSTSGTLINGNNSPIVMLVAISIFVVFKNLNIKTSRVINIASSATFGVYLIHENPFMYDFLWNHIFSVQNAFSGSFPKFLLYFIVVSLSVYVGATVIELGLQLVFKMIASLFTNKKWGVR